MPIWQWKNTADQNLRALLLKRFCGDNGAASPGAPLTGCRPSSKHAADWLLQNLPCSGVEFNCWTSNNLKSL
jgi:hypothetical protein